MICRVISFLFLLFNGIIVVNGRLSVPTSRTSNENVTTTTAAATAAASKLNAFIQSSKNASLTSRTSNENVTTTTAAATAAASKLNAFIQSSKNSSLCERIHPDELPSECSCREPGPFSLVVECLKTFNSTYLNDTIGMKIDIDPCNKDGSKVSIDVTEKDHNIDYPITGIRAGESKNIPIPGLSIIVPTIGHVGLDAAILIFGNPDKLTLKIGLNACAQLTSHQLCASSIPGLSNILPWYVLSGTYSFGDICDSNMVSSSGRSSKSDNETDTNESNDFKNLFELKAGVAE